MDTSLPELLQLARYAGRSPDLVQGAAGNISVKDLAASQMLIKASGVRISDMTATSGFVTLSLNDRAQTGQKDLRPSVEAPMHFILGRCVLHTHAIAAGILVCDVLGKEKMHALFRKAEFTCLFLDRYVSPGKDLEQAVSALLAGNNCDVRTNTTVIFLQNHGLVVSAQDAGTAIRVHEDVLRTITAKFPPIDPQRPAPKNIILTAEQGLCGTEDTEQATFARIVHASVEKYGMLSILTPEDIAPLRTRDDMNYRLQAMKKDGGL